MTPHLKVAPLVFAMALLGSACQTTTQTTNRIAVGMTQAEVLRAVGPPFSKSAEQRDDERALVHEVGECHLRGGAGQA